MIGEINMGIGDGDREEREWVCDNGADYHMSGDISLFDFLEDIPSTFHVKQIKGKVVITRWGVVRLSTDKGNGEVSARAARQGSGGGDQRGLRNVSRL